jgi:hypothetical protein
MTGPSRRTLVRIVSVLGLISLSYLVGAAVIFFKLPSWQLLQKAFIAGQAWLERGKSTWDQDPDSGFQTPDPHLDKPGATFDGFTLHTVGNGARAVLINMRGDVVHEWDAPFSQVWNVAAERPHLRDPKKPLDDSKVSMFSCHLFPNGDLLAVFNGEGDTPNGYGLAKLDKDSHILWRYSANVHHDVDVLEDGTIYATTHHVVHKMAQGLDFLMPPCLLDYVVRLSADGEELQKVSILDALESSPYSTILRVIERTPARVLQQGDTLHTNCVRVLRPALASRFPSFKPGQVLTSIRSLNVLAALDMEKRSVVWAACGPWRGQHDPHFLDNGRLLLFDNSGAAKGSRVLEYDPQTQAFPWCYAAEKEGGFLSKERGMAQRLPNGNTLVLNSVTGHIREVTREGEPVWSYSVRDHVPFARRYAPGDLEFLKVGQRPRP